MTLQLELGGIQDSNVRWALEQIAQRFPLRGSDLGNDVLLLAVTGTKRKVAFGTFSTTWTASAASAVATVTHSLGAAPVAVAPTPTNAGGLVTYNVSNFTATTFDIQGFLAAAGTATVNGCWIAIG